MSFSPGSTPQDDHRMLGMATVYRDDVQISSMIQQGLEAGVSVETRQTASRSARSAGHDGARTGGAATVRGGVGGLGKAEGTFEHSGTHGTTSESGGDNASETMFEHTAAGHLHRLLMTLGSSGHIRTIGRLQEAKDVQVGEFVEFRASFRPNELATILDVITPEVAGEIARQWKRAESLSLMEEVDYSEFRDWAEKRQYKEDSAADLARLIVRGIQADLRSDQTREYHAQVLDARSPLTAVLACEASAFVTADPDRLLDGQFTVVGKVISRASQDVSVFERSKLLARIQPNSLDKLQRQFEGIMDKDTTDVDGNEAQLGDVLDLHFPSRIQGWSFGVLPIAIYV